MTGSGVPDVNGCAKGKEFWIELKEIHSGNSLTLRPMQVAWLSKRAIYGGQVFVLARKNNQIKLFHVDGLERAQELVKGGYKSDSLLTLDIPYEWEALILLYSRNALVFNIKRNLTVTIINVQQLERRNIWHMK